MNRSTRTAMATAVAILILSAFLGKGLQAGFASDLRLAEETSRLLPPVGLGLAVALAAGAFVIRRRLRMRAASVLGRIGWAPSRISRSTHLSQDAVRTLLLAERRIRSVRPARTARPAGTGSPFRAGSAATPATPETGARLREASSWARRR